MSPSQTILRLLRSPLAFFLLAGCASVPHVEDAATPSHLYKEIVTLSAKRCNAEAELQLRWTIVTWPCTGDADDLRLRDLAKRADSAAWRTLPSSAMSITMISPPAIRVPFGQMATSRMLTDSKTLPESVLTFRMGAKTHAMPLPYAGVSLEARVEPVGEDEVHICGWILKREQLPERTDLIPLNVTIPANGTPVTIRSIFAESNP